MDLVARLRESTKVETLCPQCMAHLTLMLEDARGKEAATQIEELRADNERLTNALQVIEAGSPDPVAVATAVLEFPARKAIYG